MISPKPAASSTPWLRLAVLGALACVVMAAFGFWWFGVHGATIRAKSPPSTPTVKTAANGGAVAVSQRGLETLSALGSSIYWAGARTGMTYELTQRAGGSVYLRYLPAGTPIGSSRLELTVASYPVTDAYTVTRKVAFRAGSVRVPVRGGIAFYRAQLPTNIYVAYPGSGYQIEVFDPSASAALDLVTSGDIRPVTAAATGVTVPKTAAVAVYPGQLQKLATQLGRPLYWAGRTADTTYELTQTPDGRVYVRYLPAGTPIGSSTPYLTVGTYPVANAYATTQAAAKQKSSVAVSVPGGVAFYSKSRPTSVYIAFPKVNEQIEVYDPSPSQLRAIIAAREIRVIS